MTYNSANMAVALVVVILASTWYSVYHRNLYARVDDSVTLHDLLNHFQKNPLETKMWSIGRFNFYVFEKDDDSITSDTRELYEITKKMDVNKSYYDHSKLPSQELETLNIIELRDLGDGKRLVGTA